jgi:hypothetical protein
MLGFRESRTEGSGHGEPMADETWDLALPGSTTRNSAGVGAYNANIHACGRFAALQ